MMNRLDDDDLIEALYIGGVKALLGMTRDDRRAILRDVLGDTSDAIDAMQLLDKQQAVLTTWRRFVPENRV